MTNLSSNNRGCCRIDKASDLTSLLEYFFLLYAYNRLLQKPLRILMFKIILKPYFVFKTLPNFFILFLNFILQHDTFNPNCYNYKLIAINFIFRKINSFNFSQGNIIQRFFFMNKGFQI